MANENAINLVLKYAFRELFFENLKFTIYRLRYSLLCALIILATNAYLFLYAYSRPPDDRWVKLADDFQFPFWTMLVLVVAVPIGCLIHARRFLRDPRTKDGWKYRISQNGVQIEGVTGNSNLNWVAFVGARERSKVFWLYVAKARIHLIPKRCFTCNDDIVQFRELIRTNVLKAKLRQ